ncbi:hypothetical protein Ppro_1557 [Pelobacter propionicus DSM 2379]|uniref:Uncharacterized protein n=1 Tax=Pelobacter propionicus (strain DSM 2379 / NBRC 103807 / OttBd1) TaxID=338966 RepID=A1APA2_PELPD|nr:hypothetical protein Ppro_1557 [Pelobacter propionicus DSM 2379]
MRHPARFRDSFAIEPGWPVVTRDVGDILIYSSAGLLYTLQFACGRGKAGHGLGTGQGVKVVSGYVRGSGEWIPPHRAGTIIQ